MTGSMTDRTLPHPWGLCDVCGKAAGLPDPQRPDLFRCPACAAREALRDAAEADLHALAAPIVGAWAAQWTAAGLSLSDLEGVTEHLLDTWVSHSPTRRVFLRRLARQNAAPAFEIAPPERVTFELTALPLLTAYHPANTAQGEISPHFADSVGRMYVLYPGCDVLTLQQPDGGAVILYVGSGGQTPCLTPSDASGFRVPARLWPLVETVLRGQA